MKPADVDFHGWDALTTLVPQVGQHIAECHTVLAGNGLPAPVGDVRSIVRRDTREQDSTYIDRDGEEQGNVGRGQEAFKLSLSERLQLYPVSELHPVLQH